MYMHVPITEKPNYWQKMANCRLHRMLPYAADFPVSSIGMKRRKLFFCRNSFLDINLLEKMTLN